MLITRSQNNTQEAFDKFNVKELIEFERFCRDNAQWDQMKKCFAPDSSVKVSWFQGTGYEFVHQSSLMKVYAPHKLYNTLVWLNGDKAVSVTMATIQTRSLLDGVELNLLSDVKLVYRTRKIKSEWFIVSIDAIYEQDSLIPVSGAGLSASVQGLDNFRPSYAHLSYVFNRQGYEINTELPGIDRPESVNQLFQEMEKWFEE